MKPGPSSTRADPIRRLEELTLNAWPGLKQVVRDGWVARLSRGFTGRANSVVPLDAGALDPVEKIEFFESLYAAHGLPTTFKLTPSSRPAGLERLLAARGYRAGPPTGVQVCEDLSGARAPDGILARAEPSAEWTDSVVAFRAFSPSDAQTLHQILSAIALPCRYVVSADDHGVAACALAVLEAEWVGLYDIVTRPDARRRGHASRVVSSLLAWGRDNGASSAYLQVMTDNAPALALYARFGFREAYRYVYHTRPL